MGETMLVPIQKNYVHNVVGESIWMLLELLAVAVARNAHWVLFKILLVEPFACPVRQAVTSMMRGKPNVHNVRLVDLRLQWQNKTNVRSAPLVVTKKKKAWPRV